MKVRSDFVTNSSSSSYIIAVKNDMSDEQFKEVFDIFKNKAIEMVDIYGDGDGDDDEEMLQEILCDFESQIKDASKCGLTLDNWKVVSGEAYSDDCISCTWLYHATLDTEYVKIQ